MPADSWTPRRLVVCGDDPLTHRLVDELVTRYRAEVTVILANRSRRHGPQIARLPVRVIESSRLDVDTFRAAGLAQASALALVQQDDVGNIHAALQAQEVNPTVRLVIRMFNMSLGNSVRRLFPDCRTLSDAYMAAPVFVAAALGQDAPLHLRVAGRTLRVARREETRPQDVLCGLSGPDPGSGPAVLPPDRAPADVVLAIANGVVVRQPARSRAGSDAGVVLVGGRPPGGRAATLFRLRRWARRRRRRPFAAVTQLVSPKLRVAGLVLFALLVAATALLAVSEHTSLPDAAYLTLLDMLGGADADLTAGPVRKLIDAMLTVVSIALIPVVTATVVEAVVNARLALAFGRLRTPVDDHAVVVGLGNVGTRVIRQLNDLGVEVVAVDRVDTARGVQVARDLRIPVVIGDAGREETLRAASVQTCRALVVVSTDDLTNLEAALHARALNPGVRVVLRLFDGDFADRVQRAFGIATSRSVSYLAAPAFAAAMLEREVIGTIPVSRRVLLVAEVPVGSGSALHGARLSTADAPGQARVIAIVVDDGRTTLWSPSDRTLAADDVLVVVATRAGLGGLLQLTAAPAGVA